MAEYIVTVNKGANWQQLNTELTSDTSADSSVDSSIIPDRQVTVVDLKSTNNRNTIYDLEDSEATALLNDSRVQNVKKVSMLASPFPVAIQEGQDASSFNKTNTASGNQDNWGLLRHISETNNFGTSTNDPGGSYNYVLDGTGVDVVIMDSGIQADHPEWQDSDGNSRLQQIDWTSTYSGSATQHSDAYTDLNGHGTHVAGTVAGKTFGWAKGARIYSIPYLHSNGSVNFSNTQIYDIVKDWHNAKSGADAGRPTVVNMSFVRAYACDDVDGSQDPFRMYIFGGYYNATGGSYRGTSHTDTSSADLKAKGVRTFAAATNTGYAIEAIEDSTDAEINELTQAGIHVVIAGGNSNRKMDISTGVDYNNYVTFATIGDAEYNRPGSPWDDDAIKVGALDSSSYSSTLDQKATYSNTGTAIDLWAAGTDIISAYPNISGSGIETYSKNSSYKQKKLQGTSMATPQVAGMVACLLQAHPDWTPAQVKQYFKTNAKNKIYDTGLTNDYTSTRTLSGGAQRVAYFPMNGQKPFTYTSS